MFSNLFAPKKSVYKQTTFIKCEKCGNELCGSNSFVSDTYDENNDNHVLYKCSKCGYECDYNFDVFPIPVKWTDLNNSKTI